MQDPFWKSTKVLLNYKPRMALLLLGALVGATCFGAGIGLVMPMLQLMLKEQVALGALIRQKVSLWHGAPPWLSGTAFWVADHIPANPFYATVSVLGTIAMLTLVGALGRYLHELMTITIGARAAQVWRERAYRHLIRMPLVKSLETGSADHISRLNVDTRVLADGYQAILGKALLESLKSVAALGMAFFINWKLSVVALVGAPLILVLLRRFGKKIMRASKAALSQRGRMIGTLTESLGALSVVKVHNAEGYERRRFRRVNQDLFAEEMRMRQVKAYSSPLVEMLTIQGVLLIVGVSAWFIIYRHVDPAEFFTVLLALGLASGSVRPLSQLSNQVHEASAAAERVLEILDLPVEPVGIDDRRHAPALPRHRRAVEFDRVLFTYPRQEHPAVRDVSLAVDFGRTVAIVGSNGSGKTTLLNFLPRLLEPDAGRVLIDGVDIAAVNLRSLREQIAVVTQQTVLFSGTIAENIAYGRRWEGREKIVAAGKAAFADEFVSALPRGYDTVLGEAGTGLSGGQRQRLCIARAILRDPAVLILDEATSQIDADSEAKINQVMRTFRHGRTTFVIAHRLSTVVDADLIVVMDEGQIVDQGTHAQLLARCAIYRTLNQTQLLPNGAAG